MIDPGLSILRDMREIEMPSVELLEATGRVVAGAAAPEAPRIPVIIDLGEESLARLRELGFVIRSSSGRIVTADMDLRILPAVAELRVRYIEMGRPMTPELDTTRSETRTVPLHAGTPPNRGRNVIVGIIDSGIDWRHDTFRDGQGKSRILAIWDQSLTPMGGESSPAGFGYGVEYFKSHLDQALSGAAGIAVRHSDDRSGHGTHVAGIAAGNGRSGGTFIGIAPEADIVVVKNRSGGGGLGNSVTTLEAVRYIFAIARQAAKACVINLSQGDNIGSHDGTSLLEVGVDGELGQPGLVLIKSAGNEGANGRHAQGAVPRGGRQILSLSVPPSDPTPEIIDLWYPAADQLELSVTDPTGHVFASVAPGASATLQAPSGNRIFAQSQVGGTPNGQNRIQLQISPGTAGLIVSGAWVLGLTSTLAGTGASPWHAWIQRGDRTAFFNPPQRTDASTISIPGTAIEVLTVGSYSKIGTLSGFSSRGPTTDGRIAPTLCAPGEVVTSARAASVQNPASGPWMGMRGTSMAAPHAAGIVALMLAATPTLTASAVKQCLEQTARSDAHTGPAVSSNDWGRGKIDAQAAVGCAATAANDDGTPVA